MKRYCLLFILACCTLCAAAVNYTVTADIPYSPRTDAYSAERCTLDVYHPTDTAGLPVVVWFHGGGLTAGRKELPDDLRNCGLVVVGVNYRLMPRAEITDCIDDAAAAVAWTFRNIARYGGDPSKIIVSGHSAGGYLTSMVGLDRSWLARYGVEADSIAALVPFSGQAITHFAQRRTKGMSELQPLVDELAPLFHVRKDAPPYIIVTGDRELELYGRYEENAYLWRMMRLAGHPDVTIHEIKNFDHASMAHPAHSILKQTISRIFGPTADRR